MISLFVLQTTFIFLLLQCSTHPFFIAVDVILCHSQTRSFLTLYLHSSTKFVHYSSNLLSFSSYADHFLRVFFSISVTFYSCFRVFRVPFFLVSFSVCIIAFIFSFLLCFVSHSFPEASGHQTSLLRTPYRSVF